MTTDRLSPDNYVDGGPTKPIHTYEEALRVTRQFYTMTDRLSPEREKELRLFAVSDTSEGNNQLNDLLREIDAVRKERDARLDIDALTDKHLNEIAEALGDDFEELTQPRFERGPRFPKGRAALRDVVNAQVEGVTGEKSDG